MEQQKAMATLEERERLARELHDGLGQVLGYLGMQAQTAREWLSDGGSDKAIVLLERLESVAKDGHADIREAILSLRTAPGQDWSLLRALSQYVEAYQRNYGVKGELSVSDRICEDTFAPGSGAQLLRVIQEALTNARKHGGANHVSIVFEKQDGRALINISDDGSGFDAASLDQNGSSHFGIAFMRERMAEIGGTLDIDSRAGSGTVVQLEVPAHI